MIVWSFFRFSLDQIVRRYEWYGIARYDGTVIDVKEKSDAVRRFQQDPRTRLFVGNPAAAGAGLTLHEARTAIYESFSNQGAHYPQSLDRIHRRGQRREVRYLILLAEGTIEQSEYDGLLRKEQAAQQLLSDDVVLAPSRGRMLDELLRSDWSVVGGRI